MIVIWHFVGWGFGRQTTLEDRKLRVRAFVHLVGARSSALLTYQLHDGKTAQDFFVCLFAACTFSSLLQIYIIHSILQNKSQHKGWIDSTWCKCVKELVTACLWNETHWFEIWFIEVADLGEHVHPASPGHPTAGRPCIYSESYLKFPLCGTN